MNLFRDTSVAHPFLAMPSAAALLLLLLLSLLGLVRTDEDLRCVAFSGDCARCIFDDGCGWCSEGGYCAALRDSQVCPADKVKRECRVASPRKPLRESCDSIYDCDACAATPSCQVCFDAALNVFACRSAGASCSASDPYSTPYGLSACMPATTAPANPALGSGDGVGLSSGALAGIVIGSVVGGMLLASVGVWYYCTRRDSYPEPFRAPAAAYRP